MAERCSECGRPLENDDERIEERCEECTAFEHDDCDCDTCRRVRSRYARIEREREALHAGGLSRFGLEVLGWLDE